MNNEVEIFSLSVDKKHLPDFSKSSRNTTPNSKSSERSISSSCRREKKSRSNKMVKKIFPKRFCLIFVFPFVPVPEVARRGFKTFQSVWNFRRIRLTEVRVRKSWKNLFDRKCRPWLISSLQKRTFGERNAEMRPIPRIGPGSELRLKKF